MKILHIIVKAFLSPILAIFYFWCFAWWCFFAGTAMMSIMGFICFLSLLTGGNIETNEAYITIFIAFCSWLPVVHIALDLNKYLKKISYLNIDI